MIDEDFGLGWRHEVQIDAMPVGRKDLYGGPHRNGLASIRRAEQPLIGEDPGHNDRGTAGLERGAAVEHGVRIERIECRPLVTMIHCAEPQHAHPVVGTVAETALGDVLQMFTPTEPTALT